MAFKLFRDEVMHAHHKRAYGDILLVYPVANIALVFMAAAVIAVVIIFFTLGHYTRHESVIGVLEPNGGAVKLYAPQSGILKISNVQEGQRVHKGDVLLVFSTEHEGTDGKVVEAELDKKLTERVNTMQSELTDTLKLQKADAESARESLSALEGNQEALRLQIQAMTHRVQAAEKTLERYEALQKSGFVADVQVQEKRDDLTDQQVRLSDLRKSLTSQIADITRARRELTNMPLRDGVVRAQLFRNISSGETELSKQQNEHAWSVIAPCDGVVASLTIAHHQTAAMSVPLITIIPTNTPLLAKLYASSHALGFLKPGQVVKIKLDAFPYQKFGFSIGTVRAISDSPVLASEISAGNRLGALGNAADSLYTIDVALQQQFVSAYGKRQRLRPGMQLEADIELDTRSLYEWVLEPLYSMRRD